MRKEAEKISACCSSPTKANQDTILKSRKGIIQPE